MRGTLFLSQLFSYCCVFKNNVWNLLRFVRADYILLFLLWVLVGVSFVYSVTPFMSSGEGSACSVIDGFVSLFFPKKGGGTVLYSVRGLCVC